MKSGLAGGPSRKQLYCTSTRVASFMTANDVSGRNFSFMDGVRGGHHDVSHHANDKAKLEQGPEMYQTFRDKQDGCIKVVLTP